MELLKEVLYYTDLPLITNLRAPFQARSEKNSNTKWCTVCTHMLERHISFTWPSRRGSDGWILQIILDRHTFLCMSLPLQLASSSLMNSLLYCLATVQSCVLSAASGGRKKKQDDSRNKTRRRQRGMNWQSKVCSVCSIFRKTAQGWEEARAL